MLLKGPGPFKRQVPCSLVGYMGLSGNGPGNWPDSRVSWERELHWLIWGHDKI